MAIDEGKNHLDNKDLLIADGAGLNAAGGSYSQVPLDPGPLEDEEDDDDALMDDFDLGECISSTQDI